MKLQTRAWLFGAAYLLGPLAFMLCLPATLLHDFIPYVAFGWILLFVIAQFIVFRCPYCHKLAMFGPYHKYHPTIGRRCRHCGKDY
jgi:hypothetical protein